MQLWNTAKFDAKSRAFTFEFDGEKFEITSDVVVKALHLPTLDGPPDNITNETIFKFVRNLGYNGETTKIGGMF